MSGSSFKETVGGRVPCRWWRQEHRLRRGGPRGHDSRGWHRDRKWAASMHWSTRMHICLDHRHWCNLNDLKSKEAHESDTSIVNTINTSCSCSRVVTQVNLPYFLVEPHFEQEGVGPPGKLAAEVWILFRQLPWEQASCSARLGTALELCGEMKRTDIVETENRFDEVPNFPNTVHNSDPCKLEKPHYICSKSWIKTC